MILGFAGAGSVACTGIVAQAHGQAPWHGTNMDHVSIYIYIYIM